MAFDTYMQFLDSDGSWLQGESQVKISGDSPLGTDIKEKYVFEIDEFSFDIEQTLNMGSQSSGAGAGKVTFNPYSITRKTDRASAALFTMCCAGQHFKQVSLYIRKAGGNTGGGISGAGSQSATSGVTFLRFDFALVAVKSISWSGSDGDEAPKEEVQFEYGALKIQYCQQDSTGKLMTGSPGQTLGTWNRIWNNASYDAYLNAMKAT
ncbi:MAG: type VI secretion system tube protein Hcp [Rhodospirillales bacterium]|jgi:type VI secretion system secreted protein Hcp|nr:type VI secretion system tube protein Hcp [Rhodospirillales bacterium]